MSDFPFTVLEDDPLFDTIEPLVTAANGGLSRSLPNYSQLSSSTDYGFTIANIGGSKQLNIPNVLQVDTSGGTITNLTITGLLTGGSLDILNLTVRGNSSIGDAASDTMTVNATSTFASPATFNSTMVIGDAAADPLTVNATATFKAPATFEASVQLGNDNADTQTLIGIATFRDSATAHTPLHVDGPNGRTIVNSQTALTSAADDAFAVRSGTAYFEAPASGRSVGLRFSTGATASVFLAASATTTPDLVIQSSAGNEIGRVGGGATEFLSVGASPATAGSLRLPASGNIEAKSGANTRGLIAINASDDITVGDPACDLFEVGTTYKLTLGASDMIRATSTGFAINGFAPFAAPVYTVSNHTDRTTIDETAITLPQLANVVGTIIKHYGTTGYGFFA